MRRSAARVLDEYLAAAARTGDRAALEKLARRWEAKLRRHAYRLTGDVEMARDVAQEGWADIISGLPRLSDAALFPSWAFRIVTRRSIDAIRRAQRQRRTSAALSREPQRREADADLMETKADRAAVRRALALLPSEQRAAVALYYLEELSVAEIAAALAAPVGTIKTRLMHARRKLRAALENGGDNVESRPID